jgi:uncharacterized membrane protein
VSLVIYLVKDKTISAFLKFHCFQSMGLGLAYIAAQIVLTIVGAVTFVLVPITGLIQLVLSLGFFVYWIILTIQTAQGKDPQVPLLAEQIQSRFMGV